MKHKKTSETERLVNSLLRGPASAVHIQESRKSIEFRLYGHLTWVVAPQRVLHYNHRASHEILRRQPTPHPGQDLAQSKEMLCGLRIVTDEYGQKRLQTGVIFSVPRRGNNRTRWTRYSRLQCSRVTCGWFSPSACQDTMSAASDKLFARVN